ncbi:unnamed protein product [Didymodactylos carnosus]|uniref:Uncharacterized protein n=1 Tax=Didymodactylos carnosus TaxID=1234261 RepID=A0A814YBR7_9BILA|nr:unnamed protein product [Didymodactylos carnosus]CAF1465821.1 unnamed protein product [Didymodactylos carnosus]CAF3990227.1 unnamed protein product [Didymodactylos carnosus]CAF4258414.1 unnamed protein product [Didymodactylos carnosus]
MAASTNQRSSSKNCLTCENLREGKVKLGILTCDGCSQQFCYPHMGTHRQELSNSLELLVCQRNQLATIITPALSSNEKFQLTEQNDRIDKWESETIDLVRTVANQIRENLIKIANKRCEFIRTSYDKLTQELNTYREAENYFESDIDLLTKNLNKLTWDIDHFQTRFKIEINDNKTDWTKLIQIKDEDDQTKTDNKPINSSSTIVDQSQSPLVLSRIETVILKCQPKNRLHTRIGGHMRAGNSILLFFDDRTLWRITCNNMIFSQQPIEWIYDSIIDILWSTYLKDFIVLTKTKLMKYRENQELVIHDSGTCTYMSAYERKLFLVRQGYLIEEYDMDDRNYLDSPKCRLLNYWKPPVSCAENEKIHRIAANKKYIALIISWNIRKKETIADETFFKFELRNHSMFYLRNIKLGYCCSSLLSISVPNEWLMDFSDRTFVTIDEELKTREQTNILSLPINSIQFMPVENKLYMAVRYKPVMLDQTMMNTIEFYEYL